jgi:hypothetical protein
VFADGAAEAVVACGAWTGWQPSMAAMSKLPVSCQRPLFLQVIAIALSLHYENISPGSSASFRTPTRRTALQGTIVTV